MSERVSHSAGFCVSVRFLLVRSTVCHISLAYLPTSVTLNYCPYTRGNTHRLWLTNISKRSRPLIEDNSDLRRTVVHT
jgi:hypothetical protein